MAFGRKDESTESGSSTSKSGRPASSGFGNLTAFIDQGSEFEGKLSFKDTVRIDGRFSGEISSENTLIVGESGEIEANIHSPAVVISGAVTGDIVATRQLVLHKTARLTGDVTTPNLVMEEGATLNGRLKMDRPGSATKAPAKPEATSASASKGHGGSPLQASNPNRPK